MKYFTITFVGILLSCLFITQIDGFLGFGGKHKSDGKCSSYKAHCGGLLTHGCCKTPYICEKSTAVCGKDKLCCLTETDIQRHKEASGNWLQRRNGK